MVSQLSREYWITILTGWASQRLPPPQYDECENALREMQNESEKLTALRAECAYWRARALWMESQILMDELVYRMGSDLYEESRLDRICSDLSTRTIRRYAAMQAADEKRIR